MKVLVLSVLILAAYPIGLAAADDTIDECEEFDSGALKNLKKFTHDRGQIDAILSAMVSYGGQCSFEKSYEFCATELKIDACVNLVQARKEDE